MSDSAESIVWKKSQDSTAMYKEGFVSLLEGYINSKSIVLNIDIAFYSTWKFPRYFEKQPFVCQYPKKSSSEGRQMSSDVYSAAFKSMFNSLGISQNATEHSVRRGVSGFRYYVLRETLEYIQDFSETLTYIGFHDPDNYQGHEKRCILLTDI